MKRFLVIFIAMLMVTTLFGCAKNRFMIVYDYDHFQDAGQYGFYQKGDKNGFVRTDGSTNGLKTFTLDEAIAKSIVGVSCYNNIATFIYKLNSGDYNHAFMDLKGNVVLNTNWGYLSDFTSTGYAIAQDRRKDGIVTSYSRTYLIDKTGEPVTGESVFFESYPFNTDILIFHKLNNSQFMTQDESASGYYVMDKDLNVILDNLQIYDKEPQYRPDGWQCTIFGDDKKFVYKKDDQYYIYDISTGKTVADYADKETLLANEGDFIAKCEAAYLLPWKPDWDKAVNGVVLKSSDPRMSNDLNPHYWLEDEEGNILLNLPYEVTWLSYYKVGNSGKGNFLYGTTSDNKTVVIFDATFH